MSIRILHAAAFSILVSLGGCIMEAKRGSVIDNETRVGKILLADGSPAINARVRVFPVDHLPDSSLLAKVSTIPGYSTRTDSKGRYRIDSLPRGEYNILGELEGEYSFQDSVYLSESTGSLSTDTLEEPGSLRGVVGLQPQHDPRTVTVQALGTNSYSNVDENGRFHLLKLGRGEYTLRVVTTLDDYTALVLSAKVGADRNDSLQDTLRLPFTGIPVVDGLRASYDTLRQTVHLSWNPVKYRNLSGYLVYRDPVGSVGLSSTPIARITENSFSDPMLPSSLIGIPVEDRRFEYRVRALSKTGDPGDAFLTVEVNAVSFLWVKAKVRFEVRRSVWNPETRSDSVLVLAIMSNPTRRLVDILWDVENGKVHPAPRKLPGGSTVADSLRFEWPNQGPYQVYTRVTDDAGTVWYDSLRIPGNSAPVISGVPDSSAQGFNAYSFKPIGRDPDSDSLRFSIDNLPKWASFDTATGELTGVPENLDSGVHGNIVISVRDGRRSASLPAFGIRVGVNPWRIITNRLNTSVFPLAISMKDGIHFFSTFIETYDPDSNRILRGGPTPSRKRVEGVQPYNEKILVFTSDYENGYTVQVFLFDPTGGTWEPRAISNVKRWGFAAVEWHGKYYIAGASYPDGPESPNASASMEEYDPIEDRWTLLKSPPHRIARPAGYSAEDGIWYFNRLNRESIMIYHSDAETWEVKAGPSSHESTSFCAAGGKMYSMFPENGLLLGVWLKEFDFTTNTWKARTPYKYGRNLNGFQMTCGESDDKIYFLLNTGDAGGTSELLQYDPRYETYR